MREGNFWNQFIERKTMRVPSSTVILVQPHRKQYIRGSLREPATTSKLCNFTSCDFFSPSHDHRGGIEVRRNLKVHRHRGVPCN